MRQILKDNKGFSLLELMAALGIAALIMGIAGFSLAMTPASQAKKCTLNIDAMMTRTRSGTLAKDGDVYMEIFNDVSGNISVRYYENDKKWEEEHLTTGDKVQVFYSIDNTDSTTLEEKRQAATQINKDDNLFLAFNRSTTGFYSLGHAAAMASSNSAMDSYSDTANDYCTYLWIKGGEVEYCIQLGPTTGTHYPNIG